MKSVVYRRSKAGLLTVTEVEKPVVKGNEVLVKIGAATVTASDTGAMGGFLAMRLLAKQPKPRESVPGVEFAGVVEAVGPDANRFKAGDRVFGSSLGFGAWAEYIRIREDGTLVPMPAGMTYTEACGLCDGGITALLFLRDLGHLGKGMQVLVNGASGSVGTYAVQIAHNAGAEVTAVCGPENLALARSLGAGRVIDYTKEDFTQSGHAFDIIFDAVGKSSFSRCKGVLKETGVYMTTVPTPGVMLQKLWPPKKSSKRAAFMAAGLAKAGKRVEGLLHLKELAEAGKLVSVVDRRYPLAQINEALLYVGKGHKRGNVVVAIED